VTGRRAALEQRWLELTRVTLPGLARERRWPVREDHCFQRILLDAVCGGVWYRFVPGRPAYRHLDETRLEEAVALAERVESGAADLPALNQRSLAWRREARGAGPVVRSN